MRLLVLSAAFILAGCATRIISPIPNEAHVSAKLTSLLPAPIHCGVVHIASPATYKVLRGPEGLMGKEITVLVGCMEMSRTVYGRYAGPGGDLTEFVPGDIHYLSITRSNVHRIEVPDLPGEMYAYYLRAASLKPLLPN